MQPWGGDDTLFHTRGGKLGEGIAKRQSKPLSGPFFACLLQSTSFLESPPAPGQRLWSAGKGPQRGLFPRTGRPASSPRDPLSAHNGAERGVRREPPERPTGGPFRASKIDQGTPKGEIGVPAWKPAFLQPQVWLPLLS